MRGYQQHVPIPSYRMQLIALLDPTAVAENRIAGGCGRGDGRNPITPIPGYQAPFEINCSRILPPNPVTPPTIPVIIGKAKRLSGSTALTGFPLT
jgi:hypothetical protein